MVFGCSGSSSWPDSLQHTATHTATHCNAHCNTLQHTATHCNSLQHTATHCNTLQHTATHCNTLQHMMRIRLQWKQQLIRQHSIRNTSTSMPKVILKRWGSQCACVLMGEWVGRCGMLVGVKVFFFVCHKCFDPQFSQIVGFYLRVWVDGWEWGCWLLVCGCVWVVGGCSFATQVLWKPRLTWKNGPVRVCVM